MKRTVSVLAAALLSISALAKDPVNLSVMSFNTRGESTNDGTNSWIYRYVSVALMIEDLTPDIIGFQEATLDQLKYFAETFSQYKWVGVGRQDGKKQGDYTSLLYNSKKFSVSKSGSFWLSETPGTASAGWGADHPCNAFWAIVKDKKSGSSFLAVNTHLDVEDNTFRQNAVNVLLEQVAMVNKDNLPVVLLGGFEMEGTDAAMAPLDAAMDNARDVAFDSDNTRTYHNYGKVSRVVDHIYLKGFSSCSEFKVITERYNDKAYMSDHNAIQAKLILQ